MGRKASNSGLDAFEHVGGTLEDRVERWSIAHIADDRQLAVSHRRDGLGEAQDRARWEGVRCRAPRILDAIGIGTRQQGPHRSTVRGTVAQVVDERIQT